MIDISRIIDGNAKVSILVVLTVCLIIAIFWGSNREKATKKGGVNILVN